MFRFIRMLCVVSFVCLALAYPTYSSFAVEAKKATKTAKKSTKSIKEDSAAVSSPEDEKKVEDAFGVFSKEWIEKLNHHGSYGPGNMKVEEDPNQKGAYVASYLKIGDVEESKVKKTTTKGTPYVGTLTYEKITFGSKGKTPEEARAGSFEPVDKERVTEVFRYANGKWIY